MHPRKHQRTHFNKPVAENSIFSSTTCPFSSTGRLISKTDNEETTARKSSASAMSFPGHSRRPNPKIISPGSRSASCSEVLMNRSGRNSEGFA